jgi:excisionase family DNA binding protein
MQREHLTVSEVAEHLGLSQFTIRAWLAARRLAFVRLGRSVRIPRTEVNRILNEGLVTAWRRRA